MNAHCHAIVGWFGCCADSVFESRLVFGDPRDVHTFTFACPAELTEFMTSDKSLTGARPLSQRPTSSKVMYVVNQRKGRFFGREMGKAVVCTVVVNQSSDRSVRMSFRRGEEFLFRRHFLRHLTCNVMLQRDAVSAVMTEDDDAFVERCVAAVSALDASTDGMMLR